MALRVRRDRRPHRIVVLIGSTTQSFDYCRRNAPHTAAGEPKETNCLPRPRVCSPGLAPAAAGGAMCPYAGDTRATHSYYFREV